MALEAVQKYAGQVRFEYHPFPYSELGFTIAEALEAAGAQGKFWELHRAVIENAPEDEHGLWALAAGLGLDMPALNRALEEGTYRAGIEASIQAAEALGVKEVALFVNGKEYRKYPGTLDDLSRLIESELERIESHGKNG